MSSTTAIDRAAAEKAEADRKAAEDAAAANSAVTANWPIGGYNTFNPLLFMLIVALLALCVDTSTVSVVRTCMIEYQYVCAYANAMMVIISWINLVGRLPIFSTICATPLAVPLGVCLQRRRKPPPASALGEVCNNDVLWCTRRSPWRWKFNSTSPGASGLLELMLPAASRSSCRSPPRAPSTNKQNL